MRDTEDWKLGRRGEILADIILSRHGFTLLDAANTGDRATTLHRYETDLVAPDYFGVMSKPLWFEIKTKRQNWHWRGGPRADNDEQRMPSGPAQGIDRVAYDRYCAVQRTTGIPVVLLLIVLETGEMLANCLDSLGVPFQSIQNELPLVNWPTKRFIPLYTFNIGELDRYFYDPPLMGETARRVRRPPLYMPAHHLRELVFNRLKPVQRELEGFRQNLFEFWNRRWTA